MKSDMKAMIRWIPTSEGGRKAPPTGPIYSCPVRFEDDRDKWPDEAWSLVLKFDRTFDSGWLTLAKVQFLSEEAPTKLLHPRARFELREGPRVVARGVILPNQVKIPHRINDFTAALLG